MDSAVSDQKSAVEEEEKLDKVVSLEDILDDVYKLKFQNGQETWGKAKKRGFEEISNEKSESSLNLPGLESL